MITQAITTDDGKYAGKLCRCRKCGMEDVATFEFDYYPMDEVAPDGRHYLMCERCLMTKVFEKDS